MLVVFIAMMAIIAHAGPQESEGKTTGHVDVTIVDVGTCATMPDNCVNVPESTPIETPAQFTERFEKILHPEDIEPAAGSTGSGETK